MTKKIKEVIERLIEINIKLKSVEQDEDIAKLLSEKDALIEELKKLKQSMGENFTTAKNTQFKDQWKQLQELEKENLKLFQERKDSLGKELSELKTHSKTIGAYKFNKEYDPRLFDDSV